MKVKMLVNLGTRDAGLLGIEQTCLMGDEVTLSKTAGEKVVDRGWGELLDEPEPAPKPATIEAVPPAPAVGKAKKSKAAKPTTPKAAESVAPETKKE